MALETPYDLKLKRETRDGIERSLCIRLSSAISDASQRDDQLQAWRDQLEGLGESSGNQRWKDACTLTDPISMESFITILSQLSQALHRESKVAIEAFNPEDEESASQIEQWLIVAGKECNLDGVIYDAAHNASRDPAVVIYCGWKQIIRQSREVGYQPEGSDRVYTEDQKPEEEGIEYKEVPYQEEVTEEGYDIRVVDLADFYVYPATAPDLQSATLVAERMTVTADDLIDGIEDYGYDEEMVNKLLEAQSAGNNSYYEQQNDQDGIQDPSLPHDGLYEIFTVYTRLPRIINGDEDLPEYLRQDDFLAVICPDLQVVLKLDFSPYKERPYISGGILPKPNRLQGYSLMGMLEDLQTEANANVQFYVDSLNMTMTPALLAEETEATKLNKYQIYPGAVIPVSSVNAVKPVEWDRAPARDGLAQQSFLENRAKALVSAEGQGQLTAKVRKSAEIDNLNQQVSSKFGLYLFNFQRTIVADLYRRMIALKLQFGDVDDDGEEFVIEGKPHKITSKALKGKYNVVPVGTSLTHSPETRIQIGQQKQKVQSDYFLAKVKLPPDLHKYLWHMARQLLIDLGERNPDQYIGEEPEAGPQQGMPQIQGQAPAQFPIPGLQGGIPQSES